MLRSVISPQLHNYELHEDADAAHIIAAGIIAAGVIIAAGIIAVVIIAAGKITADGCIQSLDNNCLLYSFTAHIRVSLRP